MPISKETYIQFIDDYLRTCPEDQTSDSGGMVHYYKTALSQLVKTYPDFDYDQFLIDHCQYKLVLKNMLSKYIKFDTYRQIRDKIQDDNENSVKQRFVDNCVKNHLRLEDASDIDKSMVVTDIIKYGNYVKSRDYVTAWLPIEAENINDDIFTWCSYNMDLYYFVMYFYRDKKRQKFVPSKNAFLGLLKCHMTTDILMAIARVHGKFDLEETNIILENENHCDLNYLTIDFDKFNDKLIKNFTATYCNPRIPDDIFLGMLNSILSGKYTCKDIFSYNLSSWVNIFVFKYHKGIIDNKTIEKIMDCPAICDRFKVEISKNSMMLKKSNWDSIIQCATLAAWLGVEHASHIQMNEAAKEVCAKEIIKKNPIAAYELLHSLFNANNDNVDKWYKAAGYSTEYLDLLRSC